MINPWPYAPACTRPAGPASRRAGPPAPRAASARRSAPTSRVWFTLSHGILNEIYYPRVDQACTRDLGPDRHRRPAVSSPRRSATPTHQIVAGARRAGLRPDQHLHAGRYRIEKEILTDPRATWCCSASASTRCSATAGGLPALRAAGAAPGQPRRRQHRLGRRLQGRADAVRRSATARRWRWPARRRGARSVRVRRRLRRLAGCFRATAARRRSTTRARERQRRADRRDRPHAEATAFVLALGFGRTRRGGRAPRASPACIDGFDARLRRVRRATGRTGTNDAAPLRRRRRADAATCYRTQRRGAAHARADGIPGGIIASLSIPWGFAKGDDDLGGYHLVWPRDLVETRRRPARRRRARRRAPRAALPRASPRKPTATGRRTCGSTARPYWNGIQMDETALPDPAGRLACARGGARRRAMPTRFWPMVAARRRLPRPQRPGDAAGPLGGGRRLLAVHARPSRSPRCSPPPTSPSGAARADHAPIPARDGRRLERQHRALDLRHRHRPRARPWASTATTCASRRPTLADAASPTDGFVPIKNRPPGQEPAGRPPMVSPDALALVRFGLRAADDPRIVNTVQGDRRAAEGRDAARAGAGTATTATATASTRTARPFDGTASAAPGRC